MTSLSTEDSASLNHALSRLLQERYGFADGRRRDLVTSADSLPSVWTSLVELGLTGLMVAEEHGGFGGGAADLQRVQSELGRALVVSPWLGVALGAHVIRCAASSAQQTTWLGAVADGSMTMALAQAETPVLGAKATPTIAHAAKGGWRIDGRKSNVLHSAAVSHLLISACHADGDVAWFLVDAAQTGIEREQHRLVDHSWCADLVFDDVAAERLGASLPATERAALAGQLRAVEIAGYCAEMAGGAQAALALSVQYLRTRQQFGLALADYQALRHRIAEMAIAMEQLRSAEELALEATELDDTATQARRTAQAQLVACDCATWILRQAIQLHGGMGMTEEVAVGHHYRRQLVVNALTGGEPGALAVLTARA